MSELLVPGFNGSILSSFFKRTALSADAFVEDERRSIESGMNGHYAKPVDFTALQHNIGVFLREKEKGLS